VDRSTTVDDSTLSVTIPVSEPSTSAYSEDILISAIDILPTTLPLDASLHFTEKLVPYVESLITQYRRLYPETFGPAPVETHCTADWEDGLARATVAKEGKLTAPNKWLYTLLDNASVTSPVSRSTVSESTEKPIPGANMRKRVLLLGSGLVARPFVEKMSQRKDVELLVGKFKGVMRCCILRK
jgi:alpha-aminoadipic semialdehyde synthase